MSGQRDSPELAVGCWAVSGQLFPGLMAVMLGVLVGIVLFVPFVAYQYRRQGKLTLGQTLLWAGFLVYGLALWTYTLLPLPDPATLQCSPTQLRPFQFIADIRTFETGSMGALVRNPAVMQVALNVMLFVPLGFFVRLVLRRGFVVATLAGFAMSLAIEFTQLTGVWGIYRCAYRVFDVDDLMVNTAGALAGGLLSLALIPWVRRQDEVAAENQRPRPVTFWRRLLGMFCDALAVTLVGGLVGTLTNVVLLYGFNRTTSGNYAEIVSTWLPFAGFGVLVLITGRTPGDLAVLIRWDGGVRPRMVARLLRYLGGVGGWQLLLAWFGPFDAVFVLVSVIVLIVTRGRGGLPGVVSRMQPVDARVHISQGTAQQVRVSRGVDASSVQVMADHKPQGDEQDGGESG